MQLSLRIAHEIPKGTQGAGSPNDRGKKNRQFLANKWPYLRNGAIEDHSYNDRLIGSHMCTFNWYQSHRTWMILNGRYALCCRNDMSFEAHCKNLNEDRPILSPAKV